MLGLRDLHQILRWMTLALALTAMVNIQAAPQTLRIDGSLFNASGAPITGSRDIQIKAFDAATGGSAVWTSSVYNTSVSGGRFSIALDATADTTSLTSRLAAKAASGEIWFEIHYDTGTANGTMDSDVTVAPRIRGKGTMFALVASKADSLTGVTATALEMNYLAGLTASVQTQIASASSGGATKVSKSGDSMSGGLEVGSTIVSTGAITAGTAHDITAANGKYKIDGYTILSVGTGFGANNLFVGTSSGSSLTSGTNNMVMGASSGSSLTSGSQNLFIGPYLTGSSTTSGTHNVFLGSYAGATHQSSSDNTFLGYYSGYNTKGQGNTLVGSAAGMTVSTQSFNTLVGFGADDNLGTASGAVAVGYNAIVTASSAVQLGQGTNSTANTLQFQGYNFLDKNGNATFNSINSTISAKPNSATSTG